VVRPRIVVAASLLGALVASDVARAEDAPASGRVEAAKKHLEEGEVKREEGKWADAQRAFERAADLDPANFACHVRLQEAGARAGAAAALAARYEKLVADRPLDAAAALHKLRLATPAERIATLEKQGVHKTTDVDGLRELGRAYLAVGQHAPAKKLLDLAQGLRPADRELVLLFAEAAQAAGDATGAQTRLEQALREDPEAWDVHLALARLHALADRPKDAGERADLVLALRPTHLGAMILKAETLSRLGKPADALKVLEGALAVNPADLEARVAWADLTAKSGTEEGLKKAIEAYLKVVAANPRHGHARYGLAWAYERQNNLVEAEKNYKEALLAAPGDVYAVNSLGLVLLRQKRFAEAATQFKKAIDLDPQSPAPYLNLGATFDEQQQWSEALTWYAKCLKLKGQDKNIRALLNSAFDNEALVAYGKAEDFLVKVRAIKPDEPDYAVFLGDNLYFQKKWKAAIKQYLEATKLDPKHRFAWRGLGAAQAADGKAEDAVESLEKARALKADDAQVLFMLGDLYYRDLENLDKALDAYQAYVKAGGTDTSIPGLIEQIKAEIAERKK
jgi:tetratricopeptide (TPR) repeat protein